jgi:hypothetical protein
MANRQGLNAMNVDASDNGSSFDSDADEESFSDDDSSLDDSSTPDTGEDQSNSNDMKEICDIAQEDSRILQRWRYIILLVLIVSFIGTITAIIMFIKTEAKKDEEVVVRIWNIS